MIPENFYSMLSSPDNMYDFLVTHNVYHHQKSSVIVVKKQLQSNLKKERTVNSVFCTVATHAKMNHPCLRILFLLHQN